MDFAPPLQITISQKAQPIRLRGIALGLFLAVAVCVLTPFNNDYRQATPLGGGHFPLAPFFIFVWMVLATAGLALFFKGKRILTGKELLTAWVLMVLVSGVAYTGLMRTLILNLTTPQHFASIENQWEASLHPLMPKAWYPGPEAGIDALYNGLPGGRQMAWIAVLKAIPWRGWIPPMLSWGVFIALCYFLMLCMVSLLSRQALQNERMPFPLLQVPQLMADALDAGTLTGFLGNRYLVVGMLLPCLLHLMNGLNLYHPEVPQIPTLILAGGYFGDTGLFSGFSKLKLHFYPAFIGFAFLTSRQISFSFWFFFMAAALLIGVLSVLGYDIPAAALGVTFGPTLARPEETQMIGAYLVFFLFLFWLARHHLLNTAKQAFSRQPDPEGDVGWFSTRFSVFGILIAFGGILGWFVWFGMSPWTAVWVILAFFITLLVATRVICQGGIAYFTLTAAPLDGLLAFLGPGFFTHAGLLMTAVTQKVLFVDLRESIMPSMMHARKTTLWIQNQRLVMGGILLTLILGVAVSFTAMLALCYKFGIRELQIDWASRTTLAVYENVASLMASPVEPSRWVIIFTGIGALVMLTLVVCYHRLYWWPIHPIGYLTAYSSAMRILWVSFFLGWLFNALCMRYGGVTLFRRLRFFFIGLVIGDFMMGGIWAVVGLFAGGSYQVLPG